MEAPAEARSYDLGLTRKIRAAGGVPRRRAGNGVLEVLLVYRTRYRDWTFPKGKVKDGESDEAAALREVEEETSLACRLGAELPSTTYRDPKLREKTVRYWAMDPISGTASPTNEVDDVAWLPRHDAHVRLTHEHDRVVLAALQDD